MKLKDARPGDVVEVVEVEARGDGGVLRRVMGLGFVPGTVVEVLRRAPLGDPTEYALRGARISLRGSEAGLVTVRAHEAHRA